MEAVEGLCGRRPHFLLRVTERAADGGQERVHIEEDVIPRCLLDNLRETDAHTLPLLSHAECVCIYMYMYMLIVVCLTLLASFFLPSLSLYHVNER